MDDERVAELITTICIPSLPTVAPAHWSTRTLASETGIRKSTVARHLHSVKLNPHRTAPDRELQAV